VCKWIKLKRRGTVGALWLRVSEGMVPYEHRVEVIGSSRIDPKEVKKAKTLKTGIFNILNLKI
jgi:hypothetical protein